MIENTAVTHYKRNQDDTYTITIIPRTFWDDNIELISNKQVVAVENTATIYIPLNYNPDVTIAPKDYIIKGISDTEINPNNSISTFLQNNNVQTVICAVKRDYGSEIMWHWMVEVKQWGISKHPKID